MDLDQCWYKLWVLGCTESRVILSIAGSLLMVIIGVCSSLGLAMIYQAIKSWWMGTPTTTNLDDVDEEAFAEWLSTPAVASYTRGQLRRIPHLNDFGLLDVLHSDQPDDEHENGLHYAPIDLPPRYDAVIDSGLPSYEEAVGLNRVLPGFEIYGSTWV